MAHRSESAAEPDTSLFDVEPFRQVTSRLALLRRVPGPTLVLGSTQPAASVDRDAMARRGVTLARRRSGGGAVYLAPGEQLWVDVWIPRADALWTDDVSRAAAWVGAWWAGVLGGEGGRPGLEVHAGRLRASALGRLVCFAGLGPGEVLQAGRKIVGLAQWRSREGALFSSCAYRRWDPAPLVELLEPVDARPRLLAGLRPVGLGLAEMDPPADDLDTVKDRLVHSLPGFATA